MAFPLQLVFSAGDAVVALTFSKWQLNFIEWTT